MRISDWSSDVCSSDLRLLWNPSAHEMIEATPRGQPWIAVAVERDHRIAGHDAADARHPNTSVSGGNIIAPFARGGEAQFVVIAPAALQDAALCRFQSAHPPPRRRTRDRPHPPPH